ncbi:MAG: DUF47 domain-containing protein, partial [Planctomyces sp.]
MISLGFLKYFVPQDRKFFPLFDKAVTNLQECGAAIYTLVTCEPEERQRWFRKIEQLEHRGDEITHEIFLELGRNFITPFDREDIHQLISRMDDILDLTQDVAESVMLYDIRSVTPEAIQLASLSQMCC